MDSSLDFIKRRLGASRGLQISVQDAAFEPRRPMDGYFLTTASLCEFRVFPSIAEPAYFRRSTNAAGTDTSQGRNENLMRYQ